MTLKEIQDLSDDELRIRVAEFMGYKGIKPWTALNHGQFFGQLGRYTGVSVPNYPQDLNACQVVWDEASPTARAAWMDKLDEVCGVVRETDCGVINPEAWVWAPARQRCEALVLAMEEAA